MSVLSIAFAAACSRGQPATWVDAGDPATAVQGRAPERSAGSEDAGPPPTEDAASDEPTATITLVDPGRPPRRRLRYSFRAQQKEQLVIDLRTALSQAVGDARPPELALPPVHIVVAIDARRVSPDGQLLTYAWRVTSAVTTGGATPTQLAEGMRAEVAAVEHLSGTGIIDWQGLSLEVSADPLAPLDAGATGQMSEQVRQTLRDMAAPFPVEEVGQGARWRKLSQLTAKDATITQTDAFTLVTLQGGSGKLDDVLAQTAPPQALRGSGAPAGVQARMESMLASGDAKTRFDLSRLVPQMNFDGTTTMVLSGGAPQETPRRMTMTFRVQIALSGGLR